MLTPRIRTNGVFKVDEAKRSSDGISVKYVNRDGSKLQTFNGYMGCPIEKVRDMVSPELRHRIDIFRYGDDGFDELCDDIVWYLNNYTVYTNEIPGISNMKGNVKKEKEPKISNKRLIEANKASR